MRGQPLALRLAAVLAVAVVGVLLIAGLLVNRSVSRSLEETLSRSEEARLELAVNVLEEQLADGRRAQPLLRGIAQATGGRATLLGPDGSVLAQAGRLPAGDPSETLTEPIQTESGEGRLEISVPSREAPFLRAFNAALVIAGVLSVLALIMVAALLADRLTRPLRGVAAAARRLGAGDLAARAAGGSDRESAELAGAFNAMADRIERSEMLRRRASSDMAHDLATPATVLESQLQAMVDGVIPANAAELDRARASAAALSGVIIQLGELASAEAAPLQRQSALVDARELVAEVVASLDGLFRERGVTALVDPGSAPLRVHADRGHLARALRNVIANAAQHSPRGRPVVISGAETGAAVELRVTDSGPGIAPRDLAHVFERFYRADPARGSAPSRGSGIGLTIARELLAANGGEISVERTDSDGTTFLIKLPRVVPPVGQGRI
ncbi:MAG: sensor histidine kinase [Candidatus Limnocylindria bacterium]